MTKTLTKLYNMIIPWSISSNSKNIGTKHIKWTTSEANKHIVSMDCWEEHWAWGLKNDENETVEHEDDAMEGVVLRLNLHDIQVHTLCIIHMYSTYAVHTYQL